MVGARSRSSGQTAMEYTMLIAILVSALLMMAVYIKRSFAGRLRASADSIGEPYAPKHTTSNITLTMQSDTKTESELKTDQDVGNGTKADVMVTKTTINNDVTTRSGNETVGPLGTNLWE